MADLQSTIEQIKSEIQVNNEGKGSVSVRGAARLADVDESGIRRSLASSADEDPRPLAVFLMTEGFDAADLDSWREFGIPDTALALILEYFAYETQPRYRTERSKQCCRAFRAIGIRAWMQGIVGWQDPSTRKLTTEEVAQICLLPGGRDWKKRFDDEYYAELARLTGLEQFGNARPPLWGKLTDEWVYQMLPIGVREGVRQSRDEQGGWHKLHQFLSDNGLAIFERHMNSLLIVMKSSESVNGVRRALKTLTRTEYQHRLFEDCRKDGKLTISHRLRNSA